MAKTITGYAAVWDSPAFIPDNKRGRDGGFYETIRRGAFARSLRSGKDVIATIDHNPTMILGRLSAGNLTLKEDDHGLRYEITPPTDVSYVRDLYEQIRAGNIRGSSFQFGPIDQDWAHKNGQLHRELREVQLTDVSVVTQPAYSGTSVQARTGIPDLDLAIRVQELHEREIQFDRRHFKPRGWQDDLRGRRQRLRELETKGA